VSKEEEEEEGNEKELVVRSMKWQGGEERGGRERGREGGRRKISRDNERKRGELLV